VVGSRKVSFVQVAEDYLDERDLVPPNFCIQSFAFGGWRDLRGESIDRSWRMIGNPEEKVAQLRNEQRERISRAIFGLSG